MNFRKKQKLSIQTIKSFIFANFFMVCMLGVGLTASGCASLMPASKAEAPKRDIVRAVKLIGPDKALLAQARKKLNTLSTVDVVAEDSFADLTLILKTGDKETSNGLFDTTPSIVGILKQQQKPTIVHLSYSLLSEEGKTLSDGNVVGMGDDKTSYFPSLKLDQDGKNRTKVLENALNQLKKELTAKIRNASFTSKVTTQMATNNQVGVPVYRHANLTPTHTFHVRGAAKTKLRFVGMTQGLDGSQNHSQTHALLEVVEGQMPALNHIVVLD